MSNTNISFDEQMVSGGSEETKYNQAITYILTRLNTELKEDLYYHGIHHTLEVMGACKEILKHEKDVSKEESNLLFVAAAYHDCGFLTTYRNHEEAGCEIAKKQLKEFSFSDSEISRVCSIIMSSKIPQMANDKLDQILCDADLDYLGGENFNENSENLRKEFLLYGVIDESVNWIEFQLDFLTKHHYWTSFSLENRKPSKDKVIERLKSVT